MGIFDLSFKTYKSFDNVKTTGAYVYKNKDQGILCLLIFTKNGNVAYFSHFCATWQQSRGEAIWEVNNFVRDSSNIDLQAKKTYLDGKTLHLKFPADRNITFTCKLNSNNILEVTEISKGRLEYKYVEFTDFENWQKLLTK